jgi:hypothetical protein
MVQHTDGLQCLPTLDFFGHVISPRTSSPTPFSMARLFPLPLLLSFAAHVAGLPLNSPSGNYSRTILTIREEAKSDSGLSNEAIISIAVPIGIFVIGVATRIKRNHARERKAKPQRKVHRRWYRSRR